MAKTIATKNVRTLARPITKRIPNTDKRQDTSTRAINKKKENTELKVTTCYGGPDTAPNYDDIVESGVKYKYPSVFENVLDGNDRKTATTPAWTNIKGYSLEDKDAATNRDNINYAKEIGLTEGYHKQPDMHVHTDAENKAIRSGHMQKVYTDDKGNPAYDIVVAPNNQIDKKFIPIFTVMYGGQLPRRTSNSSTVS
jgi:hypothetical protein